MRLAGSNARTGLRWKSIADFLAGEPGTAAQTGEPLIGVTYSLSSDQDAISLWTQAALTETSEISGNDVANVGVRFPVSDASIETTVMALCLSLVYGKPIVGEANWTQWDPACSAHVWEMCACMAPSHGNALARVGAFPGPMPVAVAFPIRHGSHCTYGLVCRNHKKHTTHVYGYRPKQPFPFTVDSYWTEPGRTLPMSEAQVVARMLAFAEMYPYTENRAAYPWYDSRSGQYTYASAAPYTRLQMETYVDVVRRHLGAGQQGQLIVWKYNDIFAHVTADGGITDKDTGEYVPHGPFMLYDKGKGIRVHQVQRHAPAALFENTQISFDALYIRHARYVLAGHARYYIADQASGTYNLMLKLETDAADAPVALRVHWRKGRGTSVAQDFALSQKLAAHGVGPKVYLLHDVDGHAAFSTEYYNKKALEAGSRVDGLEDALVELYVRLSTIMQCTDTKPANVVMQQQNKRTSIAVIDPSGCTVVESATFIGPVDMYDLDVALKSGTASRPFALASICLLVYVIVARLVSPNAMPGVASVLLDNLTNVEGLIAEHDNGRDPDHTAKYMLDEYMGTSKNKRSMQDFLASKPVDWKPYEIGPSKHAVEYWRGKGMILDDPTDDPSTDEPMFERVHEAILAQAQRDTKNRADTGTVERHARRVAARIAATPLVPGMDDTGIQAHLRVDRLTAMVVHGLSKNPGTDLESLYGPLVKLTGAESAESVYELLADGKHNVVFASGDTVLRVNKKPGDEEGLAREAAVSRVLHEHAIGPRVLGTYMLGAHAAVALERYVHGSLDAVFADGSGSLTNLSDALVELYARLATVVLCVDTKPGNVVLSYDSKLGVIDVDLCVPNPGGVAYIGPIDLHDLEAMLAREDRARKGMSIADFEQKPLLFAAIALTIFVVAAGSHAPGIAGIADIASVLLRRFDFVWYLFTVFDTGNRKRRFGAIRALKHYAKIEATSDDDAKTRVRDMLTRKARDARKVISSHSAAYWTGEARMIRDAEHDEVGDAAHLEAALRKAATALYGTVSESVVSGHARAVAARVAGKDLSRMSAVEIQETLRVDRLTADVLGSRDRPQQQEPEPEPASLYTEGPAFESAPLAQTERGKEREGASASAEGTFAADLLSALRAACAKGLR